MAKKKAAPPSVPVETHKHLDTRPNIPTRETAAFAEETAAQPFVVHRDRSLDPLVVWKSKDEQDAHPFEVPTVPLHVQEKIHPQAIIEAVKAWASTGNLVADLFSDFNGLDDFSKKLEFYQHDQHWTNRLILGDSLLLMASLAEKERLRGQVQCIYFDPPYGIKFGSNWQVSTRKRDVKDAKAEDLTRQPEQIKAFRDTWELGIHSYLTYLRDRLTAARDLLTESGSIFVQIGDENVHLVRSLMDEVFGSGNFSGLITFKKTLPLGADGIPSIADYIVWYAKNKSHWKFHPLYEVKPLGAGTGYTWVEASDGTRRKMTKEERNHPESLPKKLRPFFADNLMLSGLTETCFYSFDFDGKVYPQQKYSWKTNRSGMERLIQARRIIAPGALPDYIRFFEDFPVQVIHNVWDDTHGASDPRYVVQTSLKVIERCLLMTTDPGDLVLDPTCVRKGTRVLVPHGPPLIPPQAGGDRTEDVVPARVGGDRTEEGARRVFPACGEGAEGFSRMRGGSRRVFPACEEGSLNTKLQHGASPSSQSHRSPWKPCPERFVSRSPWSRRVPRVAEACFGVNCWYERRYIAIARPA